MDETKCPRCGLDCVVVTDEVDIGVGIQEHILGWDCSHCGPISACNECGAPDDNHHPWCKELSNL